MNVSSPGCNETVSSTREECPDDNLRRLNLKLSEFGSAATPGGRDMNVSSPEDPGYDETTNRLSRARDSM